MVLVPAVVAVRVVVAYTVAAGRRTVEQAASNENELQNLYISKI